LAGSLESAQKESSKKLYTKTFKTQNSRKII